MRLDDLTFQDYVALYEQAVSSIDELCSELDAGDWDKPTDCPGWSVKDHLSHVASYESFATGRAPKATADISHLSHLKPGDAVAEANEREIEARRARTPEAILSEFRDAAGARLKHLTSLSGDAVDTDISAWPWGESPTKNMMPIRVLDLYYHEQDMRRAAGRPGHMRGDVARYSFERMAKIALPRVFVKLAEAPEGSTIVWDVPEPGRLFAIASRDGRGDAVDAPADPTVRFTSDLETFLCLFGGRVSPSRAQDEGRLKVAGDRALAQKILDNITVVP
ncbi:MAG: maleylpyruvate isomerase family mycothiol-dependent enzyme [Actinomycetota bacterium]